MGGCLGDQNYISCQHCGHIYPRSQVHFSSFRCKIMSAKEAEGNIKHNGIQTNSLQKSQL